MVEEKENQYFWTLSVLFFSSIVILASLGETGLGVYVSLFTICYYLSYLLFRPKKKWIDFVGMALLVAFVFFGVAYFL